jgi:hypothetical protein
MIPKAVIAINLMIESGKNETQDFVFELFNKNRPFSARISTKDKAWGYEVAFDDPYFSRNVGISKIRAALISEAIFGRA